ncbi:MAG: metalloregulator ArsR/SmtB family transcription factor [Hyphomicrobiales bacterium]
MESVVDPNEREVQAALMLSALGNESRLRIYRLLVRAGPDGLPVGDIQERIEIPASTLSHHIAALRQANLVKQHRVGRTILSCANYANMDELVNYLTEECCTDALLGDRP